MSLRIEIDVESCVSSGKCVADHPDAFAFDDDELSNVLPGARDLPDDIVLRVARRCPGGAIVVYDEAGVQLEL